MKRDSSRVRKLLIGFVGWFVILAGVIMIPYPGPGWVIVFVGLSILATEFEWAQQVHVKARGHYDSWLAWLARQKWYLRAIFWCLTALTVVVTVWLINGYGLINSWLSLGQDWIVSPLAR